VQLSVIPIKQFRRICKWGKSLIFIGDMLTPIGNYHSFNLNAVNREIKCCVNLPKPKVKEFQLHISYFLQNCKKGKPSEISLPLLKNDITGSELIVKILDK
jgi:hypothetical protein